MHVIKASLGCFQGSVGRLYLMLCTLQRRDCVFGVHGTLTCKRDASWPRAHSASPANMLQSSEMHALLSQLLWECCASSLAYLVQP